MLDGNQGDEDDAHQGDVGQHGHQAAEKLAAQELVALDGLGQDAVDRPPLDLGRDQRDVQNDADEDARQRDDAQARGSW